MAEPNHYRMLGVPKFASPALVRRAYMAQLKRHHAAEGSLFSDERLRQIGHAYWELRHPERRAAYDAGLRERERRRTAAGKPVVKTPAPRVQLPRTGPRRGTRWLFAASLVLLAGGTVWAVQQQPSSSFGGRASATLAAAAAQEAAPRPALIDEALLDYQAMMAAGGRGHVAQLVRQCFEDMQATVPVARFDYCVALDGMAAADLPHSADPGFFSESQRRARLASVAFQPVDATLARSEAIDRLVALRLPNRRP